MDLTSDCDDLNEEKGNMPHFPGASVEKDSLMPVQDNRIEFPAQWDVFQSNLVLWKKYTKGTFLVYLILYTRRYV